MSTSNSILVFPSTGAVSVTVNDDEVWIQQEDCSGNDDRLFVSVPRILFKEVLRTILTELDHCEIQEIAEIVNFFAKPCAEKRGFKA